MLKFLLGDADFQTNYPDYGAGDLVTDVVLGLLIVFSVLAIIYFVMVLMKKVFYRKSRDLRVRSPFDGVFDHAVASGSVSKNSVAAVVTDSNGIPNEILSPAAGTLVFQRNPGDNVAKGDVLFVLTQEVAQK